MYKLVLTLALVVSMFQINFAKEESFNVDVEKSKLEWHGKKVTGEHNGLINIKDGMLMFKDGKLAGGEFQINMQSIINLDIESKEWNDKLVNHLKSDDFFSVEKFPTTKFKITEVKEYQSEEDDHNYWVKGDLTIKGITNAIEFTAKIDKAEEMVNGMATIVVDRSKFDVRYGSGSFFEGLGDKLIYDDFEMKVSLAAVK